MATHTEWLNGPEDVMFAWTELQTYVDRTGQLRLLLKESADELDLNNYSIFVVASKLERRLLITRVNKDEGDMLRSCTRVAVHSYQSLLECLRSTDCVYWQKPSVNIFCQHDMYYSAVFFLAILQIMHAVKTKAFKAKCRCLIMITSPAFLGPLSNALGLICPKLEFTQVTIPQFDMMADNLQLVSIASSDFVDYVVEEATEVIKRRKMVIIFCTRRTGHQILRRIARELPQENCLWNEVARADFIAKTCWPEPNTEEGVILFMTESCQVPLYFDHVCHIFIEGLKDKPTWNRSRIVYERQVLMRDEAECMISYWYQCHPNTKVTITDRDVEDRLPRRLVDSAQSWGFLADLALHFTEFRLPALSSCFMTKPTVLQTVMLHFAILGFLQAKIGGLERAYTACEDADTLAKLLVLMDHDFHLAWFVFHGMRLPDTSVTARCAILRIGALATCNSGVVNKPFFRQNAASQAKYQRAVDALVLKLQGHANMPRHLYNHGLPWITLMIWHLAQKLNPSIRIGELQDMLAIWMDVPNCALDMAQCAHVSNIVSALESHYQIEPATQTLHLTDADCENIQRSMVAAWIHKAIMITHDGGRTQLVDVVVADTLERGFGPGFGEILQPIWDLNIPGTLRDLAFFAALHVQVEDTGRHLFDNSVVLPLKAWRSPCGETFLDCARYFGPDAP